MRKGDTGTQVRDLQRLLTLAGFPLELDGWYGDATEAAVKAFQKRQGLVQDGVAGGKTLQTLQAGKADPRLLTQGALDKAAQALGVDLATVMAVNAVESQGSGFLVDGRPKILYERHVMLDRLKANGINPAPALAAYPALVNPKRGGYAGGAAEYTRLASACHIDPASARESCSWGQFQVMGYHWKALGYPSIDAFVTAMAKSENDQLEAFTRFILADKKLLAALQAKEWEAVARQYNGPAYRENLYDVKLAHAYARFAAGTPAQGEKDANAA